MSAQYIYTMRKLTRFYPPDREVLKDINLSFYPGAKIGVLGANGAGKSSLLRIMAGLDDGFSGEARLTSGYTVGFLSQEPQLDPAKDVLGNVLEGVAATKDLLDRFDVITNSEVFSALPTVWTRIATVLCLGIGVALTIRFVVFLAQLSTARNPARSSHQESEPA